MTVLMGERLGSGAHRSGIEPLLDYAAATSDGHGGTMLDDRAVRLQFADALADEQGERFFQARLRTMVSRGENPRSEEHTSELQSLMRISYAVFCLKKKTNRHTHTSKNHYHHNNNR